MASSDIRIMRYNSDSDFVLDTLSLDQGNIIYGNDNGNGVIVPTILAAPGAKKFLASTAQNTLEWIDLDTNASHTQDTDTGTNALKWIIAKTTGNASTECHIIWTTATNYVDLKRGNGTAWNNLKIAGLTASGITCTGAITGSGLTITGNGSFTGTLNADGNWNLGTYSESIATVGTIESTIVNAKSYLITLNSSNGKRNTEQGGIRYKYDEGGSDYITWYYSGLPSNKTWTSNKPINVETGNDYRINQESVLSRTTLGASVTTSSLNTVGTIKYGTWEANAITYKYGGTGLTDYGTGNQILAMNGTADSYIFKTVTAGAGINIDHGEGSITISNAFTNETYKVKAIDVNSSPKFLTDVVDAETNSGIAILEINVEGQESTDKLEIGIRTNLIPTTSSPSSDLNIIVDDTLAEIRKPYKVNARELIASVFTDNSISVPNTSEDPSTFLGDTILTDDYVYYCVSESEGEGAKRWKRAILSTF